MAPFAFHIGTLQQKADGDARRVLADKPYSRLIRELFVFVWVAEARAVGHEDVGAFLDRKESRSLCHTNCAIAYLEHSNTVQYKRIICRVIAVIALTNRFRSADDCVYQSRLASASLSNNEYDMFTFQKRKDLSVSCDSLVVLAKKLKLGAGSYKLKKVWHVSFCFL